MLKDNSLCEFPDVVSKSFKNEIVFPTATVPSEGQIIRRAFFSTSKQRDITLTYNINKDDLLTK